MPKISVIIPIYNVEKYLSQCLESLLNQTYTDWEAICVNDGSSDGCEEIVKQYAERDPRIKIITQDNQGLSMARNNGLKKATGDYIYFLDSDDSIHPQCLEIAYLFATEHNADLVNFEFYKDGKEKFKVDYIDIKKIRKKITSNPVMLGTYKGKYRIHFNVWTKLYKRELLNGIEFIPNIHFEDFPHTFAVLSKKPKTVAIDAKLYFYTSNPNSISFKKANTKQIKDYHTGITYIYDIYKSPELSKELKFLKHDFIPNILKQQLNRCRRADVSVKREMFETFSTELTDLNNKDLISWKGHKLRRFFTYKRLINKRRLECKF